MAIRPEEKWLKISRVDSRGKILDLTDPNPTPFLYDPDEEGTRKPNFAFNYVKYDTTSNQAQVKHRHWVDLPVLRVLAWDLMVARTGEPGERGYEPLLVEFKGGKAVAAGVEQLGADGIVSRSLIVQFNDQLKIGPVFQFKFELKEGQQGDKGQITPVPGGQTFLQEFINIGIPSARQFGATIFAYLQAKETAGLISHYGAPLRGA